MDQPILFEERQKHTQWWGWAPVVLLALLAWLVLYLQVVRGTPVGSQPAPDAVVWALWGVFGVALPAFLLVIQLRTRVDGEALVAQWWPLRARRIPLEEITSARPVHFKAMREWGGYGIRWHPKRGWAYLCKGGAGVQLEIEGKRPFLIGSQDAERLAQAIEDARAA